MLMLVVAIYMLCLIAFYAQMMVHGGHYFRGEDASPSSQSAEVYELHTIEQPRRAA